MFGREYIFEFFFYSRNEPIYEKNMSCQALENGPERQRLYDSSIYNGCAMVKFSFDGLTIFACYWNSEIFVIRSSMVRISESNKKCTNISKLCVGRIIDTWKRILDGLGNTVAMAQSFDLKSIMRFNFLGSMSTTHENFQSESRESHVKPMLLKPQTKIDNLIATSSQYRGWQSSSLLHS